MPLVPTFVAVSFSFACAQTVVPLPMLPDVTDQAPVEALTEAVSVRGLRQRRVVILATIDEFPSAPRAQLSATGLTLPDDLSFDEWVACGTQLRSMERSVMWWLGDWWLFGERACGDAANTAVGVGYSAGTLYNAASVAGRIDFSRRRENLSYSHHVEVAALDPADREPVWIL